MLLLNEVLLIVSLQLFSTEPDFNLQLSLLPLGIYLVVKYEFISGMVLEVSRRVSISYFYDKIGWTVTMGIDKYI